MTRDELARQLAAACALLGDFIKQAGMSFQQMDDKLGLSPGYTSRLLRGQKKLTYAHLVLILEVVGVTPEAFQRAVHRRLESRPGTDLPLKAALTELGLVRPPRRGAPAEDAEDEDGPPLSRAEVKRMIEEAIDELLARHDPPPAKP